MTHVQISPEVRADFDRIFDHLFLYAPDTAAHRIEEIVAAMNILESSPMIGRPMPRGLRELVISGVSNGYLALYRYDAMIDVAYILAVRSQRELQYRMA